MYIGTQAKYPLFVSVFNEICKFSADFRKNIQVPNFMNVRSVGAELFRADRRTNTKRLMVAFRNFANAPDRKPLAQLKLWFSSMWLHVSALYIHHQADIPLHLERKV